MRRPTVRAPLAALTLALALLLHPTLAFPFFDPNDRSGSTLSKAGAPEAWLPEATKGWMGGLPDDTDLRALSVPGTHDSAADTGGVLCETNSWSLPTQLDAGIRYLDIRARRKGNDFTIHHGICFLGMTYADVVREVSAFLTKNPSETVLMRLKEEWQPAPGSESFSAIWARYYAQNPGLYVPETNGKLPTLGEVRGKVLVLRNADLGSKKVGIEYDGTLTSIQDFFRVYKVTRDTPFGAGTVSLPQKEREVRAALDRARAADRLYLNYLSGSTGMLPVDVARQTNRAAYESIGPHAGKKTTGIVIMDYPGARLVYRVIKTNFDAPAASGGGVPAKTRCAARSWRKESDVTFAEFRVPESDIGATVAVRRGAYSVYKFPTFHRVTWSDLTFTCESSGQWRLDGRLGADRACCSRNTKQAFVTVGRLKSSGSWSWF